MKHTLALLAATALVSPAFAESTRQLDAHEHGVGQLNIAIDGTTVAMELTAPGADIVGFEYAPTSAEDRAAVEAAIATLAKPLDLFVMPAAAECTVTEASAELELEIEDAHEHDAHGHDDHGHEEVADTHDHDHGHEKEEVADAHDHDHGHEKEEVADAHDHDHDHGHEKEVVADAHDHDHGEEAHAADEATHSEFHAAYQMTCANPTGVSGITFAYFDTFENALELEVQVVTAAGAQAFEVERDDPTLDLANLY